MLDLLCLRRLNGQNSGVLQDLRATMTSLRAWTLTQMWCRLRTTRRAQTRDATIETSTQMHSRCNNEFLCVKGTTKFRDPLLSKHVGRTARNTQVRCTYLECSINIKWSVV